MATLDRSSHTALYLQMAEQLMQDIRAKRILPLEKLPSEYELTQLFNVSRVTVRQAIRVLVERGLVVSRQGKGVFVAGPQVNQGLNELRGFYDCLVAQGYEPQTEIVRFVQPDNVIADGQIKALGNVLEFTRLYRVDDAVIAVAVCSLSCFGTAITREQVQAYPVYTLLADVIQRKVARASTTIRTAQAPSDIADFMSLGEEGLALQLDRTSFDDEGLILETTRFHVQPEVFAFQLEVSGPMQLASSIRKVK